jgi:ATP-binding cassette subfamily B protein
MVAKAPIPSAIALLVVPSAVLGVRRVKKFRDIALAQFVGGAEINKVIQELVQGFRIVKAFNLEEIVRAEAHNGIAAIERAANKHASISNGLTPLIDLMAGIVVGLMFLYGGYRILVLGAAPGEFLSFVSAFLLAAEPAKRIARLNFELQGALVGVQVLFDVLDLPDAGEAPPKGDAKVERGRIEFDRVSFAYRADNPVLREVSFVAQPGEVTAFVGASGGGKSTIFNLVLAFYAPERGSIRLDAEDYRELSADSIRRQIAYVGQDVFLFHGTIGYNIGLGRSGATEAEIVDAARAAHAHEFISQFPGGYATPVGELGAQMSGGQRQRIAIARALIRNAPIILLDEPTAALDTESEGFVREAMAALIKGRTTLVIAHRLYTITQADMIHVVEGGTIVESGRHAELLARQGRYAQLSRLRFGPGSAERNGLQTKVSIISV